jgi:uncharacterized MAPEG superfamily protein
MDIEQVYLEISRENWLHMRHQETQRMWIANVFVALVVGVSAYLGKVSLEDITLKNITWLVPLAFFIISVLCLLITLKLNHIFEITKDAVIAIFDEKKIPIGENWEKYVGGLKSKGNWKYLKVRHLYLILYSISIAASLIFFGYTLAN